MKFCVYILYSETIFKYYTGHTHDLKNRLVEHNLGETASIKHGIPWKLVWQTECSSRSEAMTLENEIKKRGARRFLDGVK